MNSKKEDSIPPFPDLQRGQHLPQICDAKTQR